MLNSDGYYVWEVYPYYPVVSYQDENGEFQGKSFDMVNSKSEFDIELQEQIKPYVDDLLAKGLITQDYHDNLVKDPLQYYIDAYF